MTPIQEVRLQVGDLDPALPILADDVYQYYLDRNAGSVRRSALEAARTILMQLSMVSDATVDIFTVKGSRTAAEYRLSLSMFLKSPDLNPVYTSSSIYAGGISRQDILTNVLTPDNNYVVTPGNVSETLRENPFSI